MKCTCIVCGKEIIQRSITPKLYCSDHCRNYQGHHQVVPLLEVQAEAVRRKAQYIAELSPEQRKEREKAKRDRTAFHTRQAKIQQEYGDPVPTRYCHNFHVKDAHGKPVCRNKTWNYYCDDCRQKKKAKARLNEYTPNDWEEYEWIQQD